MQIELKWVPCWSLGARDAYTANAFISDSASCVKNRIRVRSKSPAPLKQNELQAGVDSVWRGPFQYLGAVW
jgi:hypothetical protein